MYGIESKVEVTLRDSSGSFLKTIVMPFAFENTSITNPSRRKSDNVIWIGMVRGELAASGVGEMKSGVVER